MNKAYKINDKKGVAISELFQTPTFEDAGQTGWTIQTHTAVGIDYVMLSATKDAAVFPLHSDDKEWFGYIVQGSGELHIGDADTIRERIPYKTGDFVIFNANTYHGWHSTSDLSKLMFVKPSK